MKIFLWTVEVIAVQSNGINAKYEFVIKTFDKSLQNVMDIALMKAKRKLKQEKKQYLRLVICWIELIKVENRTKYDEYKRLYEAGKSPKVITRLLDVPFWQVNEFYCCYQKEKRMKQKHLRLIKINRSFSSR
ncbi:hypothetical protein ACNZ61_002109 [Enterococcus hirae]